MKLSDMTDLTKDDILSVAGLATKRGAPARLLVGLEWFAAGLIVGAGVALLFAQKSGKGLREDIRDGVHRVSNTVAEKLPETSHSHDGGPA